jgi:hypothetical protein
MLFYDSPEDSHNVNTVKRVRYEVLIIAKMEDTNHCLWVEMPGHLACGCISHEHAFSMKMAVFSVVESCRLV